MNLKNEIKELIIECLNLPDMKPSDIDEKAALFGDGLGLDSVDALELGLAIQKKYGFSIDSSKHNLNEVFYSVETLAEFISVQGEQK